MHILTIDFWNTLYHHQKTANYRAEVRREHLLAYCESLSVSEPQDLSATIFDVVDKYIKGCWRNGTCPSRDNIVNNLTSHYTNRYNAETLEAVLEHIYYIYRTILKPELYDGAKDFLQWAKSKWSLYLISDTYTIYSKVIDSILETDGLLKVFHGRLYSDILGFQKPDVASIRHILEIEKALPEELIHVGDLLDRDYELARRAGCYFILLQQDSEPQEKEVLLQQDFVLGVCSSFRELQHVLEGISNE